MSSFALVIPAHNEESVIEHCLRSCAELDYPKGKYEIYVIADNCDDRTAEIARDHGAVCLERRDQERRGKGPALEWAFPRILNEPHDAMVVIDADCVIDQHALRVFDHHLQQGAQVLQASDVVANADDSAISFVLALANVLENDLFYAPKSRLGLAVFLRGTGMVFHRSILARYPWQAGSVVEDMEYGLQLLRESVRIRFVPDVRVSSDFPTRGDQLSVQRARWIGGRSHLGRLHSLALMWEGILRRKLLLIDGAWTGLVVSRPLIIIQLLATVGIGLVCRWLAPGSWSDFVLPGSLALVTAYLAYACAGFLVLGVTLRRIYLLSQSPLVVAQYMKMAVQAALGAGPGTWTRTPRVQQVQRQ